MAERPSHQAAFSFHEVSLRLGENQVLHRITAEVPAGGITVLFGPSGSGKTSLLRLCNRLDVPTSGTVRYRGQPISELDPLRLRQQVGMVFQQPTPFPGTVRQNLAVADPQAGQERHREAVHRAALDTALLDRDAAGLSGGELQRMCLARTLLTQPETLLLDEPTSALDETPKREFEHTATGLAEQGVVIVWVTHEHQQLERVADRVLRLSNGRLREQTEDVEQTDNVAEEEA